MSVLAILDNLKSRYIIISMGHYHKNFPDNVQKDKERHICRNCRKKRFAKFMICREYEWHGPYWKCAEQCEYKRIRY